MLNLLENCSCPQKTVYVVIAGTTLVNLLGLYSGASKVGAVTKNFAVKFIISVLVVILIFKVLEWMCTKNTTGWNVLAWVIALLPLVSHFLYSFYVGTKTPELLSKYVNY